MSSLIGCTNWQPTNHVLYHMANGMLVLGLMVPDAYYGALLLHALMFLGFLLMTIWSWVILCAPDFFSWNFAFFILNGVQTFSLLYRVRSVKFCDELEDVYVSLFMPLSVSRQLYKKLVCPEFCTLMTLHKGETYATQSVTRTDKLGLLISGVMHAYSNRSLLHPIMDKQFIDSPEFEVSSTGEERFQVSIVAAGMCRYLFWPRKSLEYLLIKEPYLAYVMKVMIGRDITNKLYALNEKALSTAGSRLDIRLPSITSALKQRRDLRCVFLGATGHDAKDKHQIKINEPENDLDKNSDAEETIYQYWFNVATQHSLSRLTPGYNSQTRHQMLQYCLGLNQIHREAMSAVTLVSQKLCGGFQTALLQTVYFLKRSELKA